MMSSSLGLKLGHMDPAIFYLNPYWTIIGQTGILSGSNGPI